MTIETPALPEGRYGFDKPPLVYEVPMGIFRKTLQLHGASCRVPNQALPT